MKSKSIRSAVIKAGTKPGSIVYTGEKKLEPVKIMLMSYDVDEVVQKQSDIKDLEKLDSSKVNWINLTGVHDEKIIERIGEIFKLDALLLEDIVTVGSRPKYDKYENYLYVVASMLSVNEETGRLKQDELSLVIIENVILTFHENEKDIFDNIRKRISDNRGRIRRGGASYLFYSLIDSIVDQYFLVIETFEENIERLETSIMQNPESNQAKEIYDLRRELMNIRNAVWPMKDIINNLRIDEDVFNKEEVRYLGDLNDNIGQIVDFISYYRDMVMGLYEAYLSNLSNRMNRIMMTLTIFSVIFIPLTFLAGVYGMNFKYLPELGYKYSYYIFWLVCTAIGGGLFLFFKRKKWFT
jgi:magnesium transporter